MGAGSRAASVVEHMLGMAGHPRSHLRQQGLGEGSAWKLRRASGCAEGIEGIRMERIWSDTVGFTNVGLSQDGENFPDREGGQ